MKTILIYGSGGFAREVAWLAEEAGLSVTAFVDDSPERIGRTINDIQVISLEAAQSDFLDVPIVIGVGSPKTRKILASKAHERGFRFTSVIHPRAEMSRWVSWGEGTVITSGNILTTNIQLGAHVHINLNCTIGHDCILEDFVTLAPGVHVSGWVHIQRGAYIGTGAVIINGEAGQPIVIGEDAVIGAGAVVTKSIPAGVTAVGVPARPLER
jgi:sugar O-acyltransferase (sialic acid O-acetyltransferase NeuD family)